MTTLRDADVIANFARGAREIYVNWQDKLPSHNQAAVAQLIRSAVRSTTTPALEFNFKTFNDGSGGALNPTSWVLEINNTYTDKHDLEEYLFTWLCGILYHEARHAEQYYYCAQAVFAGDATLGVPLSGAGSRLQQVGLAMNLPNKVVRAAENTRSYKMLGQSEKTTVLGWFNSVWGTQKGHRSYVYTMSDLFTPGTRGNVAYINLPEEVDAYATQAAVEAAVTSELQNLVQVAIPQREAFTATKGSVASQLQLRLPGQPTPAQPVQAQPMAPSVTPPIPTPMKAKTRKGLLSSLQGLLGKKSK
jgi:hypothetical protein